MADNHVAGSSHMTTSIPGPATDILYGALLASRAWLQEECNIPCPKAR
jgi:hypothetical protein